MVVMLLKTYATTVSALKLITMLETTQEAELKLLCLLCPSATPDLTRFGGSEASLSNRRNSKS
jgi:hypothetical protein